jgi:hypothetical protein
MTASSITCITSGIARKCEKRVSSRHTLLLSTYLTSFEAHLLTKHTITVERCVALGQKPRTGFRQWSYTPLFMVIIPKWKNHNNLIF